MSKKRTRAADDAAPVWVHDAQFDGLFEVYVAGDRLELRRDGWLVDDDEDTEDGLERLKAEAVERAKDAVE